MKNNENMPGQLEKNRLPLEIECEFEEIYEEQKNRKNLILRLVIAFGAVFLCVAVFFLIFSGENSSSVYTEPPLDNDQIEETQWKGAFANKDIYQSCMDSALTVRIEMGSGGNFWSGAVYSKDGSIITSSELIDKEKGGRLYVVLNSGERYPVESIKEDAESRLAMLQVSAKELVSVKTRADDLQGGERVISLSSSADNSVNVISGEISNVGENFVKINMPADPWSVGAPVFDGDGYFVGIVSDIENEYKCTVCSSRSIAEKFVK